MKIKGKIIIPRVAIMIAMFTLGATPGFAGNTEAAESTTVYDTLSYVDPTFTTKAPLEDQVGEFLSSNFSDELQNAGDSMMETGGVANLFLKSMRRALNSFVIILERIGDILGNTNIDFSNLGNLGNLFG